uniref:LINE-1 type transposase domain-containing protein 1 n=2 Tax=Leptobrachium leishanense TaxID=445787 RepID=A0A8C5LX27_9ANUR
MPATHKSPKRGKQRDGSVAALFSAKRPAASQDGGRSSSRHKTPVSEDEMSDGNPAEADTTSILTHMREMRTYLAGEIDRSTKIMQADLMALGTRTAALETRVDDMADAHNVVVDGTNMLLRRVEDIEIQMEDLSNRTRRNNLRIRGLPEGAGEGSLADLVRDLLRPLAPDLPDQAWILDRAHRALRARRAEDERPRDVIVRFLHYSTKELILRNNRGASISYEGTPILLFQDLTPITLQRRREWKPVADLLRNHKIQFAWGHPLKILAFLDGRTHVLQPRMDPSRFFKALGITPPGRLRTPEPTSYIPATFLQRMENRWWQCAQSLWTCPDLR